MLFRRFLAMPDPYAVSEAVNANGHLKLFGMVRPRRRQKLVYDVLAGVTLDFFLQGGLIIFNTLAACDLQKLLLQLRDNIAGSRFPALIKVQRADDRLESVG